ncbi:hypothetical protein SFR_3123 [Streptomyces sp. FR-008]|nr:hypothetical protein SFR_3123 [Streptomyces sp. FR-008]
MGGGVPGPPGTTTPLQLTQYPTETGRPHGREQPPHVR